MGGRAHGAARRVYRWRGIALGAPATIAIHHRDEAEARRLIALSRAEIARLEAVFSLYLPSSALARLNGDGRLDAPPLDLVTLLGAVRAWSARTGGAFDATVQPLWHLYAAHFSVPGA
ncbi:MAG: FAD:protein FMN transferase, partial [Kiloniellaceae bacterium]